MASCARRPLVFALLAIALGACGREDIELAGPGAGLSAPDGSAPAMGDDGATASRDAALSDARICPPVQSRPCSGNGAGCTAAVECCSGRCENNVCLEASSCAGPGTACSSRADCCSGRCEPVGATRQCLNYCLADGAACTHALDCCSMACNGGKCGGDFCKPAPAPCDDDGECCSGSCQSNRCTIPTGACHATGDICQLGGNCCSGVCTDLLLRCDLGPGKCREPGALCSHDTDCCRGTCGHLSIALTTVCVSQCLDNGAGCTTDADCCGHHCSGSPAVCNNDAACALIGAACTSDSQCCSGQCLANFCGNNCVVK